jgi:hypothetical protein
MPIVLNADRHPIPDGENSGDNMQRAASNVLGAACSPKAEGRSAFG